MRVGTKDCDSSLPHTCLVLKAALQPHVGAIAMTTYSKKSCIGRPTI